MKIKLTMDCGYVGTDYEEEMEVNDGITEKELEELAVEFFWENFHGGYGYEIIEKWLNSNIKKGLTTSPHYDIINISKERKVIKMDVWKDLYYDCLSVEKNLSKQIEEHKKAILRL